jgi:hypothetical protein
MKRAVVLALCYTFAFPFEAHGEEVAAPQITANFSETIVVTGHRTDPPLPLPYESAVSPRRSEFTSERLGGREEYQYRRVLLDEGAFEVDMHQLWTSEGNRNDGPEERGRRRLRLVYRF